MSSVHCTRTLHTYAMKRAVPAVYIERIVDEGYSIFLASIDVLVVVVQLLSAVVQLLSVQRVCVIMLLLLILMLLLV